VRIWYHGGYVRIRGDLLWFYRIHRVNHRNYDIHTVILNIGYILFIQFGSKLTYIWGDNNSLIKYQWIITSYLTLTKNPLWPGSGGNFPRISKLDARIRVLISSLHPYLHRYTCPTSDLFIFLLDILVNSYLDLNALFVSLFF
jgi:hypothetical protein